MPAPEQPMQWARRSISWTSFSSPWVRARDSNRDVDLAVARPIVPAHTGRDYRAESRTFWRPGPLDRRLASRHDYAADVSSSALPRTHRHDRPHRAPNDDMTAISVFLMNWASELKRRFGRSR